MVRELFERYATDQYSMKQLETIFYNQGFRNYNGNKIAHSTLSGIISNPKYKGYYVGNKVKVVDMFTKKQKFLPPEEWVMFKDETGEIVPAIVSEEIWDKANAVLKRRSEDVKSRKGICNHGNLLTGKMFCTHCGKPYYRTDSRDRHGNINNKWTCSGKKNNGADSCPSFSIYESEIKPILFEIFSDTQVDVEALMDEYVQRYQEAENDGSITQAMTDCRRRIEVASKKKSKLLEYNVMGQLTDADFLRMNDLCSAEISTAQSELEELESQQLSNEEYRTHINHIRRVLQQAKEAASTGLITNEFVNSYIDKIYVTPEEGHTARLDIKIFTGESTQKYIEKHRRPGKYDTNSSSRTGHTIKKMIEAYENGMK